MHDFNIEDYLNIICSHIRYKKVHTKIKKELRDHIEDKVDYFKSCHFNEKDAVIKALESMGDPHLIGKQLNKEHRGRTLLFITASLFTAVIILGILLYPYAMGIKYYYEIYNDIPLKHSVVNFDKDIRVKITVIGDFRFDSFDEVNENDISYKQQITEDLFKQNENTNDFNAIVISEAFVDEQMNEANIAILRSLVEEGYFIYIIGNDLEKTDMVYILLSGDLPIMNSFNLTEPALDVSLQTQNSGTRCIYTCMYKDTNNFYKYYIYNETEFEQKRISDAILYSAWSNRYGTRQEGSKEILRYQKKSTGLEKIDTGEILKFSNTDYVNYGYIYNEKGKMEIDVGSYIYNYVTNEYIYFILEHRIVLNPNNTSSTEMPNMLRNFTFTVSVPDEFMICDYSSQYDIPFDTFISRNKSSVSVLDVYSKADYNKEKNTVEYFVNFKYGIDFAKYTSNYNIVSVWRAKKDSGSFDYKYSINVNSTRVDEELSESFKYPFYDGQILTTGIERAY